jgi:hypothetical protein
MSKTPTNAGKAWTPQAVREVKQLAAGNTPTRIIALKTGRSTNSIRAVAFEKGISLKPTNQRPYNRQKK